MLYQRRPGQSEFSSPRRPMWQRSGKLPSRLSDAGRRRTAMLYACEDEDGHETRPYKRYLSHRREGIIIKSSSPLSLRRPKPDGEVLAFVLY